MNQSPIADDQARGRETRGASAHRIRLMGWVWVGYWLVLVTLTHIPRLPRTRLVPANADKLVHFAMYFVLAMLGGLFARATGRLSSRYIVLWGLGYAAFGVLDEYSQPWVGRSASVADWVADTVGVAGASVVWLWRSRSGRR